MPTKLERPAAPFERLALPLQIAFGLGVLAVYAPTLYPSVPGGDSGELIVAAHALGVAHPPGYPLFTLLAKAATLLPAGSIAWRVNLLTASLGALAAAVLLRAAWSLTRDPGAGLLAAGLFAFSPLVWHSSIGAEVFSLNHCFVAALLSLLIAFERERHAKWVYLYGFTFGLGLTNHQTLLFVGIPAGLWIAVRSRALPAAPAVWLKAGACGIAGLTPYLYLLLSPARDPSVTWGGTSTVSGAVRHVLRRQYGTFRLGATERESDLAGSLAAYLEHLPRATLWVGAVLAVAGIALAFAPRAAADRAPGRVAAVTAIALGVYVVVFHTMTNLPLDDPLFRAIQSRFWQQADLLVAFLAGLGLWWLARGLLRRGAAVSAGVAAALVAVQLVAGYAREDRRDDRYVAAAAAATLEELPRDALVVSKGDLQWNTLRYLQVCEGKRPDVTIVDVEMLKAPWWGRLIREHLPGVVLPGDVYRAPDRRESGGYDLGALFGANQARRPVMTNAMDHDGDASWRGSWATWPEGWFDRVHARGGPEGIERYVALGQRWAQEVRAGRPAGIAGGSWEEVAWKLRLDFGVRLATRLSSEIVTSGRGRGHLREVGAMFEAAVATGEPLEPSVYLNLGIVHYLRRGEDPACVPKMVQAWRTYLDVAPPDAPQRALVQAALDDPRGVQLDIGAF
jgi:hypothetical protein